LCNLFSAGKGKKTKPKIKKKKKQKSGFLPTNLRVDYRGELLTLVVFVVERVEKAKSPKIDPLPILREGVSRFGNLQLFQKNPKSHYTLRKQRCLVQIHI
jgi:hypothetical protein